MGFENSVDVALGGSMCGTLVGEHFMMYNKGATCLGQGCMHEACGKIKGPEWNVYPL